jgi:asparagine synthase (glutamine-hydrolysing)
MCGILAIFGISGNPKLIRQNIVKLQRRLRHRGPDGCGTEMIEREDGTYDFLTHERLMITEPSDKGKEPKESVVNPDIVYTYNGEIYNYPEIRQKYDGIHPFEGNCDCQAIDVLWNQYGTDLCQHINGMFGFIVYNKKTGEFYAARDHVGIIPLYIGTGKNGEKYIASEVKALVGECENVSILYPGHYITNEWVQKPWYQPEWYNMNLIPKNPVNLEELRAQMTEAVRSHMMVDVPFGLLISGGVDSSLIAAITMKLVKEGQVDLKSKGMKEVHSFCVGLQDSPDLLAARKVAEAIGTTHHEFIYTVQEGIDTMPEVVYHLETFNPTTLRAGTPMYLMARKIKALGIKMVLTGEGADEIFGGYLYFHKAPNEVEFHKETVRKVQDLYRYDLLRANKSMLAFGVEVRPPFLHRPFIEYAMSIDPRDKHPKNNSLQIEKYILRKAFDLPNEQYIPSDVLWRQKEQFSDGVGYRWMEGIQAYVNDIISDEDFANREKKFPINPPTSKEMYWHRQTFENCFPGDSYIKTVPFAKSIACSTEAALEWDESFKKNTDESGRAVLGVHKSEKQVV